MPKLSPSLQKCLKCFHLLGVSLWLGGCVSVSLLLCAMETAPSDDALLYFYQVITFIDNYIIIIGATAALFTGLIYGLFSNWGFARHRWIILKWLITIIVMAIGAVFASGHLSQLIALVEELGLAALNSPLYQSLIQQNLMLNLLQMFLLMLAYFLSVFKKPGLRKKTAK